MASSGDVPETEVTPKASQTDPARLDRLEHQVAELTRQLAAMQHSRQAAEPLGEPAVWQAAAPPGQRRGGGRPADDALTYSGNVRAGDGRLVMSQRRTVEDVVRADAATAGRMFAALASPARITLLKTLLDGPMTTQQLRGVLEDPSVGQLYHHLKELLAAGLVVQPGRSMYALRRGSQVEICILILAATGLASGSLAPSSASSLPPDSAQSADPGEPPARI